MEFLNLKRSELGMMRDAPHYARSVWLYLLDFCAGQENGGRIEGAKHWTGRTWLMRAGLSCKDVAQKTQLWSWEGDDLVVTFYPADQEETVRKQRKGGSLGGKKKAELQRVLQGGSAGKPVGDPQGQPEGEAVGDLLRNEMKGNEMEGKEREAALSLDASLIPTEKEVRTWAEMAGVEPEFAVQKWNATCEVHGWEKNGRLIDWRHRFKRYWEEDKVSWYQKKNAAAQNGTHALSATGKPAAWKEGDQDWWWSETVDLVERAFHGAIMGCQTKSAERLKEILKARGKEV